MAAVSGVVSDGDRLGGIQRMFRGISIDASTAVAANGCGKGWLRCECRVKIVRSGTVWLVNAKPTSTSTLAFTHALPRVSAVRTSPLCFSDKESGIRKGFFQHRRSKSGIFFAFSWPTLLKAPPLSHSTPHQPQLSSSFSHRGRSKRSHQYVRTLH